MPRRTGRKSSQPGQREGCISPRTFMTISRRPRQVMAGMTQWVPIQMRAKSASTIQAAYCL